VRSVERHSSHHEHHASWSDEKCSLTARPCSHFMSLTFTTQMQSTYDMVLKIDFLLLFLALKYRINLKMMAFWDIALCSLVEVYRRFRGAYCLHRRDEGSMHMRDLGLLQRDYRALYPRQPSSSHLQTGRRESLESHIDTFICTSQYRLCFVSLYQTSVRQNGAVGRITVLQVAQMARP
jgi:hypothetical protein